MKKKESITVTLLKEFLNKGAVWQTEQRGKALKEKLRPLLEDKDYWELTIAHSHYLTGEGSLEFYTVCNKLINKYSQK